VRGRAGLCRRFKRRSKDNNRHTHLAPHNVFHHPWAPDSVWKGRHPLGHRVGHWLASARKGGVEEGGPRKGIAPYGHHAGTIPTDSTPAGGVDSSTGTRGGEWRERVLTSDSGRVPSQGRVIGGQRVVFPTIAASRVVVLVNRAINRSTPI